MWNGERRKQKAGVTHHVSRFTFHVSPFYLLSLCFFTLGLMCKPALVTLPFVLLLLDYWPLRRLEVQGPMSKVQSQEAGARGPWSGFTLPLLWEKLPFVALAAAAACITIVGSSRNPR